MFVKRNGPIFTGRRDLVFFAGTEGASAGDDIRCRTKGDIIGQNAMIRLRPNNNIRRRHIAKTYTCRVNKIRRTMICHPCWRGDKTACLKAVAYLAIYAVGIIEATEES